MDVVIKPLVSVVTTTKPLLVVASPLPLDEVTVVGFWVQLKQSEDEAEDSTTKDVGAKDFAFEVGVERMFSDAAVGNRRV